MTMTYSGWMPPARDRELRPRAERRALAVETAVNYLTQLNAADVAQFSGRIGQDRLRRDLPRLLTWGVEVLAELARERR
jgi:hypothetical protein